MYAAARRKSGDERRGTSGRQRRSALSGAVTTAALRPRHGIQCSRAHTPRRPGFSRTHTVDAEALA